MNFRIKILFLFLFIAINISYAKDKHVITVANDGTGNFKTITEAIYSLPMFCYERVVIYIKNGTYNEKLRIDQDNITLKGESRDGTIIEYNQLRTDWIANKDSIGPAVVNISGDDIIFENLTIRNTQPEIGPHAFAIYGTGTRTIILNCNVLSKGGDTVSLWNYKSGMYYHSNCFFEGAVDFVCPRGWCFIKDSKFFELKQTASVWHAGGYNKDQKLVMKNCSFDGVKNFELGRHHYDAQFYFLNCEFSQNMSDKPIYRVTYKDNPEKNRPDNWGERIYFFNCKKEGESFSWLENNLNASLKDKINAEWTFNGKWDPELKKGPQILGFTINGNLVELKFNETLTVINIPELKSSTGKLITYVSGAGSNTLKFISNIKISGNDIKGLKINNDSKVTGTIASVYQRNADFSIK